jgi:hypothetical protein
MMHRGEVDESYVDRLENLVEGLRPGAKLLLFAFDRFHDLDGRADPQRSSFYTPNAYAQAVAARHPEHFSGRRRFIHIAATASRRWPAPSKEGRGR